MNERQRSTPLLALLALGVVYGDIGTSPLYAAKETFNPEHGIPLTPENIVGGVSAIFWSLMIVVSIKYVALVLRATNRGEGGIMALLALVMSSVPRDLRARSVLLAVGLFGAALFYGDAVLTPAISVLSAIEGLEVATPVFKPYVVPLAAGVLVALFAIQRQGTGVGGPAVRTGVRAVVRRDRSGRHREHRRRPRNPERASPRACDRLCVRARGGVVRRARVRAARGDRCGGAVCGRRTLWHACGAPCVVRRRGAPPSCSTISGRARCC
jgi:hypothetical protein